MYKKKYGAPIARAFAQLFTRHLHCLSFVIFLLDNEKWLLTKGPISRYMFLEIVDLGDKTPNHKLEAFHARKG